LAKRAENQRKKRAVKSEPEPVRYHTQTEIANAHGVNLRTVARWVTVPGFPKKEKGGWSKTAVDNFVAENTLGKKPTKHEAAGMSLTESQILKNIEDAANSRIKKERQLVEQAQEFGEIVFMSDVRRQYEPIVATVMANQDALRDAQDRAMPESVPSAKAWPKIRESVLQFADKLKRDTAIAMKELA
jgi:hypothetical protein